MFREFIQYHEPAYHLDSSVRQASLTWLKARQHGMEHLGDLSGTHNHSTAMTFAFNWEREYHLRYIIVRTGDD